MKITSESGCGTHKWTFTESGTEEVWGEEGSKERVMEKGGNP